MKKMSKGVITFAIIIVMGALFQVLSLKNIEYYEILFKPLKGQILLFRYYVAIVILILSLTAGIGIFTLKESFRKLALFLAGFNLYTYIVEGPLFVYRNLNTFINQEIYKIHSVEPGLSVDIVSNIVWISTMVSFATDIGFSLAMLYFFTRPQVKEQFTGGINA